jgi:transcriptional regulator of arginine metabolism
MSRTRSNIPNTPVARRQRVSELLTRESVRSQGQLEKLLRADGLEVTQATLSRDLDELGAVKIRDASGDLVYAVPGEVDRRLPATSEAVSAKLARRCEEALLSAEAAGGLVVLRTPPGAAHFLAIAVDGAGLPEVLGTLAGDDTVFVATRDPDGGPALADRFAAMAEGRTG